MAGPILCIAEHRDGVLLPVSLEAASFCRELAAAMGAEVLGVVLAKNGAALAEDFSARAGIDVISVDHPSLGAYTREGWLAALSLLAEKYHPVIIAAAHTSTGWDYLPGLSDRINAACFTGVTGYSIEDGLSFTRAVMGGKIMMELSAPEGCPAAVTVMPGSRKALECERKGGVESIVLDLPVLATENLGVETPERSGVDLSKAEVIVAGGRGLAEAENFKLMEELASCFDRGAVAASRPVVDAGWIGLDHQVGQTGQTVAPRLYVACGISGAIQHTVGMVGSELIVAVNRDKKAAIFETAHLGVAADLFEFIPVLIEKIRERE